MKRRWLGRAALGMAGVLLLGRVQAEPAPLDAAVLADLQRAVVRDDYLWIRRWLEQGGDPNAYVAGNVTALVRALYLESWRVAEALLASPKIDVNAISGRGETALMMASIRGHLALVRKLIGMGADVNRPGWTPLHYAASSDHADSVAIAELLLEHHAYIDAQSPNHSTPLMLAAQYGSQAMVELLLREGADPQARNQLGLTVVDFARKSDRDYMVRLMQEAQQAARPSKGSW